MQTFFYCDAQSREKSIRDRWASDPAIEIMSQEFQERFKDWKGTKLKS